MNFQPTIASLLRKAGRLRVAIQLPPEHRFEGLKLRGASLLVEYSSQRQPEELLDCSFTLETPLRDREAFCFLNKQRGGDMVVLQAPLETETADRRSA